MSVSTTINGWVSVQEAAEIIGVTESLVRRWVRADRLPSERVGARTYLIPRKAAEKFSKQERKPGRPKA